MPKSKHRKGRRPFRSKPTWVSNYGADPLAVFTQIGRELLDEREEEAACALLLREMKDYDPAVMTTILDAAGLSEPPATHDDIRAIAKALVATMGESDAAQP